MPYENELNPEDGPLHEDPVKNLRIENEILQMKLRAEFGGYCRTSSRISPELENEFLKRVLEFERRFQNVGFVSLAQLIGNPPIKKAEELSDQAIVIELERIRALLHARQIVVSFCRKRDARFQYKFITEELLQQETENMVIPGLIKYFVYEDFHPDHEITIRDRTINMLVNFFDRCPEMMEIYLSNQYIQPEGTVIDRREQLKRLRQWMSSFRRFEDCGYNISKISYMLKPNEKPITAMGHSEGRIKYTAISRDGAKQLIEGAFKFYFTCEGNWWSSFFFYLPGFNA